MNNEQNEQIEKLPKWAQQLVRDLKRERESAVKALNDFLDQQTPSPFRMEDFVCTGEESGPTHKTFYVQGHAMEVESSGIRLRVFAEEKVFSSRKSIELKWEAVDERRNIVTMTPTSYQTIKLEIVNK